MWKFIFKWYTTIGSVLVSALLWWSLLFCLCLWQINLWCFSLSLLLSLNYNTSTTLWYWPTIRWTCSKSAGRPFRSTRSPSGMSTAWRVINDKPSDSSSYNLETSLLSVSLPEVNFELTKTAMHRTTPICINIRVTDSIAERLKRIKSVEATLERNHVMFI